MDVAGRSSREAGRAATGLPNNGGDGKERDASRTRPDALYRAWFFGPFRITMDDRPLVEPSWQRYRAAALLKWFLLNPDEMFSAETLCDLFWPGRNKARAVNNLHVTLHYLRRVLEPGLPPRRPSTFIRRTQQTYYRFELQDRWWTDVLEVRALARTAAAADRDGDAARAISHYRRLVDYYRLTFLPEDVYEDAFSHFRLHHERLHVESLSRLMHLYLAAGQLPNALSCALNALSVDPYSEDVVRTIVHIYLRQGNITGAIRQLDDFLRILTQDMGLPPSRELLQLRGSIATTR